MRIEESYNSCEFFIRPLNKKFVEGTIYYLLRLVSRSIKFVESSLFLHEKSFGY